MTDPATLSLGSFWAPRYWPTWLLLAALKTVALLPLTWQFRIGGAVGHVLKRLKGRQRRVAKRNLEVCFPELTETERATLLDRHFRSVGLSIVSPVNAVLSTSD